MEFLTQFRAARRVSTPLVCIRTFDARSTIDGIRASLGDRVGDNALILWDTVRGFAGLNTRGIEETANLLDGNPPESSIALPDALKLAERSTRDVIVFVSMAYLFWSDPVTVQAIWNLRDPYKASGNMLVLLAAPGSNLPPELVQDTLVLDEPLPTREHIQTIIRDCFDYAGLPAPGPDVIEPATDALIGLPGFPVEQSVSMALDTKNGKLDIPALWEHKRQTISQTPGLSVLDSKHTLASIGGLDAVKEFCTALMNGCEPPKCIIFTDEVEKAFAGSGTDLSGVKTELTGSTLSWTQDRDMDGVLCLGIPGVGKSFLVKCLGATFGVPVISFDIAAMQGGIIGSSGANLRAAQATVDAISGGRVLWVATCNSIGSLPPELRARFKTGTFFFDSPTATERESIWTIYRTQYGIPTSDTTPCDDGWTGREIRECCAKAYRMRLSLTDAARYIVPVTRSSADTIAHLRAASSGKYLSATRPGLYTVTATATATPAPVPVTGRVVRFEE